jgi:hypothetical protein
VSHVEHIDGPYNGYYVASYVGELHDAPGQFLAYVKICRSVPQSYWEADCLLKNCAAPARSASEALVLALEVALLQIRLLPPLQLLPPAWQRRPIDRCERAALALMGLNRA